MNLNKKLKRLTLPKLAPDLNYFTTAEYSAALNISKDLALSRLKKLLKAGRIKTITTDREDLMGRTYHTLGWEIVDDGNKSK